MTRTLRMVRLLPVAAVLLVTALVPGVARAVGPDGAPVSTTGPELTGMASGLGGATVVIEGEVVSEPLGGGDGRVWVNVLSEGVAVGVWIDRDAVADLEVFGEWAATGDRVRVVGVFNEGCDEHGGDLDIHGVSLELLERGSAVKHDVDWWKFGVGLVGAALAVVGYRRMRRVEGGEA